MPQRTILYWRDIPAQVVVTAGRRTARRQLSDRFATAIDMAAMRAGAKDSDAYLAEWRRGEPVEIEGNDVEVLADLEARRVEESYSASRLNDMVANGGHEPDA